uniref:ARAD1D10824p n=1 Tax=Blastobotrys adeninivorans TaxID=409370 RepID=A0A060T9C6_BLAAD
MADQLIDLSTPRPQPAKPYISDFTPTLARALSKCFNSQRRRLPEQKEASAAAATTTRKDLTMIEEDINTSNCDILTYNERPAHIDTPPNMLRTNFNWAVQEKEWTPLNPRMSQGNKNSMEDVPLVALRALEMSNATPSRKFSTPKGRKRSRPGTPSSVTAPASIHKRRMLMPRDVNTPLSVKKNSSMWTVDNNDVYKIDNDTDTCETPCTPASVKQMRAMLRRHGRGGKQKFGPLRNEVFSHYPSIADDNECNDDEGGHEPSCDVIGDKLLDAEYGRWLAEKRASQLQEMVEFLELEKRFGI